MCRPPTVAPPSSAPLTSSRAALTYTPPAQKAPVYTPKAELTFSPPTVQQPSSNSLLTQDGHCATQGWWHWFLHGVVNGRIKVNSRPWKVFFRDDDPSPAIMLRDGYVELGGEESAEDVGSDSNRPNHRCGNDDYREAKVLNPTHILVYNRSPKFFGGTGTLAHGE
ncbi:hypothetical protein FRB93_007997 [Tulasnella sp. JGI-2019a]|nr:hypothetical protein FRB93_007997 [Tulasnella sp. JGI-2019a]